MAVIARLPRLGCVSRGDQPGHADPFTHDPPGVVVRDRGAGEHVQ